MIRTRIGNRLKTIFPDKNVVKKLKTQLDLTNNSERRIVFFDLATNGNLGDQALVYASKKFFHKVVPDVEVISIANVDIFSSLKTLKSEIRPNDVIVWSGGGNIGTIYPTAELARWDVFEIFKNHKIIILPQSTAFSSNSTDFLEKSVSAYSKHRDIVVFLREQKSFDFFQLHYPTIKSFLVPDIVFSLEHEFTRWNEINGGAKESGVLTLLRSDVEKVGVDLSKFVHLSEKMFGSVFESDTFVDVNFVDDLNRKKLLEEKWRQIASHELVVTDRLHGMIFSYLTKTPAVVFRNNNWKIESTYLTWLENVDFIKLVDANISTDKFVEVLSQLKMIDPKFINLDGNFSVLAQVLEQGLKNEQK